jgi:anti-sigma factor ChrR (cupin superfamily)
MEDVFHAAVEPYVLGVLDEGERAGLEAHLAHCPACTAEVARWTELLAAVEPAAGTPPPPGLREHVLELARAPREPLDLSAYEWEELGPGIRIHVAEDDPARDFRAVLVWAQPGASMPLHRHLGDEEILVLRGRLTDGRDEYGPGEVCRSRTGSVHSETVVNDEECVCYVVYHGGHEPVTQG